MKKDNTTYCKYCGVRLEADEEEVCEVCTAMLEVGGSND